MHLRATVRDQVAEVGLPRLSPGSRDRVGSVADFYRTRRPHLTSSRSASRTIPLSDPAGRLAQKGVNWPCNSFARNNLRACCRNCRNGPLCRKLLITMERETGIEPATSSLGSWHSTAELLPLVLYFQSRTKPTFRAERCLNAIVAKSAPID